MQDAQRSATSMWSGCSYGLTTAEAIDKCSVLRKQSDALTIPAATYGPGSGITAAAGTRFAPPPPDRELTVAVCRGVRAKYRNIEAPK